jgi:hypothetical protein
MGENIFHRVFNIPIYGVTRCNYRIASKLRITYVRAFATATSTRVKARSIVTFMVVVA